MLPDQIENTIDIVKHMMILQSQDRHTGCLEKILSHRITFRSRIIIVSCAFEFNDKFLTRAVEVDDIGSDAVLSPKLSPRQLGTLKNTP